MDWEKVDLTLEGHIGGEDHPNAPRHLRENSRNSGIFPFDNRAFPFQRSHDDLYLELFRTDRNGYLMIVDDYEMGREPIVLRQHEVDARRCVSNGGECCDRCGVQVNIMNQTNSWACCDKCELEMNEQIAANPDVVFAFEQGGLRAVA